VPPAIADGLVTGDAARLAQITANLVSNAIKYSPRNAIVWITLARDGRRVRFQVRDQGPGISPENQAQLFRPFSRLSAQPTGGESSHGLGLSIVHDLVRLHDGSISVESAPGHGAAFIVELPAHG
jgi:signal transduction histidine kinase